MLSQKCPSLRRAFFNIGEIDMRKFYRYFLCGLILLTVAGCETVKGLGKDFDAMGGWVIKGSEKAKEAVTKKD